MKRLALATIIWTGFVVAFMVIVGGDVNTPGCMHVIDPSPECVAGVAAIGSVRVHHLSSLEHGLPDEWLRRGRPSRGPGVDPSLGLGQSRVMAPDEARVRHDA